MRIRLAWLLGICLIALLCAGCDAFDNDNNNADLLFRGSDTWLEHLYIGNVPVQAGNTVNVPLSQTSRIRFEVSREVTPESLGMLFDFQVRIENIDTGMTFLITDANLNENGELYWVDTTNRIIEYRMKHNMSFFRSGGQNYYLGELGDMFRVRVDFLIGQVADGSQFAFWGDEFRVVWTESSQGYGTE
jgi:hypothetical protein